MLVHANTCAFVTRQYNLVVIMLVIMATLNVGSHTVTLVIYYRLIMWMWTHRCIGIKLNKGDEWPTAFCLQLFCRRQLGLKKF